MSWSPARCSASTAQSSQASAPSSTGAPLGEGVQDRPANLSPPLAASWTQTASCSWASTLTQSEAARRTLGQLVLVCATQKEISGGSRLTEVKELAAKPHASPVSGSI